MNDIDTIKENVLCSKVFAWEWSSLIQEWKNKYKTRCINPQHTDINASLTIKDDIWWFQCWSCGLKGDIINVIEYIKPEFFTFRERLLYLQDNYLWKENNTLIHISKNTKKQENIQWDETFIEIMNYIALYLVQKLSKEIKDKYILGCEKFPYMAFKWEEVTMQWYGLREEIVEEYKIWFSPNTKELFNLLMERYNKETIDKLWLFDSRGMPLFKNRIVIPYIIEENVVYFIARQTELTPATKFEEGKYKNQSIDNKYLYNEWNLYRDCVFITEGAFDCLSLKNIWYDSIALWWLETNKGIIEKMKTWFKESVIVYILFDNDRNGSGNKKAEDMKIILQSKGVESNIITLPLLKGKSKIDINEYLWKHSKDELNSFLSF